MIWKQKSKTYQCTCYGYTFLAIKSVFSTCHVASQGVSVSKQEHKNTIFLKVLQGEEVWVRAFICSPIISGFMCWLKSVTSVCSSSYRTKDEPKESSFPLSAARDAWRVKCDPNSVRWWSEGWGVGSVPGSGSSTQVPLRYLYRGGLEQTGASPKSHRPWDWQKKKTITT